ncbi:unnamed protein product [Orchesella dallaii]|uniref:Uncharacterized protein n=1 Tax=Orchesella dallaii TaxID=48710 RepID=A0ABP1PV97_9HEXA
MGTGHSKNSPDDQMRMKMENGFDDDDEDLEAFGVSDREKSRSKSNLSFHKTERAQVEDDEYFNNIYNKRPGKSLSSLNGSSIGVKSAPVGNKKEKDPEVAAAIAELEETFKVLGDGPVINPNTNNESQAPAFSESETQKEPNNRIPSPDCMHEEINPSGVQTQFIRGNSTSSGEIAATGQVQHDRFLISRGGDGTPDYNGIQRRASRLLDFNTSSHGECVTQSSRGSSSHNTMNSRGSEQRGLQLPNHSNFKRGKAHNSQSILMQQRRDFQKRQIDGNPISPNKSPKPNDVDLNEADWTYEPPKIDGFDAQKFKEINSRENQTTIVPIMLRGEEDKGYYSRSPDIPSYTKDELDLIASLEREVY